MLICDDRTGKVGEYNCWKYYLYHFPAFLPGVVHSGSLDLFPPLHKAVRLSGEDNSFFISCLPYSSSGPVGDSRIRAKELKWRRELPGGEGRWVTMGSQTHER